MSQNIDKKELHYGVKILITMYSMIAYLYAPLLIEKFADVSLTKIQSTSVSLLIASLLFLWIIPKIIGIPKKQGYINNFKTIGLRKPNKVGNHIFLGVILAGCTLGGMLIGSLIIGGYSFSMYNISINQIYFSILPGIFEEIIFRGVLMAVLMMVYKNIKKVALIQCIVFVGMHFGSFEIDWLKIVDLLGVFVLSVGFTYVVIKTKNLLAGIVFHFLHDAFLLVVQLDQSKIFSPLEALAFYGCLLVSVCLVIAVTNFITRQYALGKQEDPIWV